MSHAPYDCDVAVVGAGIVGLAVAREVSRRHPGLRLAVLDRETEVGRHQTGHNSGVIHSGVYYQPGSMKARLCVEGARRLYEFCDEHGVAYERCGKLIIAVDQAELSRLDELERRGRANAVPGLRRLSPQQLREAEPECRGLAALHCPSTGIVDYRAVARALSGQLQAAGVTLRLGFTVKRLSRHGGHTTLHGPAGELSAAYVITCAGLWSDRLAVSSGDARDPRIVPFRGAYLTIDPAIGGRLHGLVYPVPDPDLPFLGVHITKTVDGRTTLGPTALLVGARDAYRIGHVRARDIGETLSWPGTYGVARRYWRTGLEELRTAVRSGRLLTKAARYMPAVAGAAIVSRAESGIRAQAVGRDGKLVDDFVVSQTAGTLHVRNAPSPAATSSLALASEIVDRASRSGSWPAGRPPGT
jgi:(S)-2-hydroxyglutarate dehydrogenase